MNSTELCFLSVSELSKLIKARKLSPVELTRAYLDRIERLEPTLNSFITVAPEESLRQAARAEKEILAGRSLGPLHGIPMTAKDLFESKGMRTTLGSRVHDSRVPGEDATVISRLKQAGAILVGKTNLNPLAYGAIAKEGTYDYGHMHNPWDPGCVSGGSSGGSGSATASGEVGFALGSDTGGSVRIPCSLCGIVGMKPTYGRLSRHGMVTLSWSLDSPGPMTRTVEDNALVLNAAAGFDPLDPSSADVPVPDYTKGLAAGIKGLRIGMPKEFLEVPVDPAVQQAVQQAVEVLRSLGAAVHEVSWPLYHYYESISTILLLAEGAAAHRELVCEHGAGLYEPLRMRIEAGLFVSAADYIRAQQARVLFNRQCSGLFDSVDLLVGPTTPITATKIGSSDITIGTTTMGVIALHTQYLSAFNITGLPSLTLPCGFAGGLPVGLQLVGRAFEEQTVLRAAHAYEQSTDWHSRKPPL